MGSDAMNFTFASFRTDFLTCKRRGHNGLY